MPRFYCERWSGLSLWAHALRRMIAFQGGYLNTQDPAEAAFVRTTDYFKRGMIVEQPPSSTVPRGHATARRIWTIQPIPSKDPPRSPIRTPVPAPSPSTSPMPPMPFKRPAPKHDRAVAWLKTMLRDGRPMPASWVLRQALLARISLRTFRRARTTVHIIVTKEGMTGGWAWTLPQNSDGLLR